MNVIVSGTSDADIANVLRSVEGLATDGKVLSKAEDGQMSISSDSVQALADNGFAVRADNGSQSVVLDVSAVASAAAKDGEMVLSIVRATDSMMNEDQKAVVGDAYAVEVTLTVGGVPVRELGGSAKIMIEPGYVAAYVYYVDDKGGIEEIPSKYDPETGEVDFTVTHFSLYMVSKTKVDPVVPSEGGLDMTMVIIVVAVVIVALAVIAYYVMRSRKKQTGGTV